MDDSSEAEGPPSGSLGSTAADEAHQQSID